jgi:hypothetical protein
MIPRDKNEEEIIILKVESKINSVVPDQRLLAQVEEQILPRICSKS